MSRAWLVDDEKTTFSEEDLKKLGVSFTKVDEDKLGDYCKTNNFGQSSLIDMTPENYEKMAQQTFEEHFHEYDEIRYVLNGDCIFDIRNKDDKWIRILFNKNEFFIIPAGLYHRFKGKENFLKLRKLHHGDKAPEGRFNRNEDSESVPCREEYKKAYY